MSNYNEDYSNDADEARIAAAREKAAAAAAVAEYRRNSQSQPSDSRRQSASYAAGAADAEAEAARPRSGATTPIVVKRRPTPNQNSGTPGASRSNSAQPLVPEDDGGYVPPAHEDYEANAAAMEAIRAELEQLEQDDQSMEERLQLYSEVIALRKELEVVQADEARLRRQRDDTEKIVAAHDPEVNKEVAMLEDEAQQSALQNIWKEESAIHNPEKMDWATIDITNLTQRVSASKSTFDKANEKAEALYAEQEQRINEHTDNRERTKQNLRESYEEEMANLSDARQRMRMVESEQRFHQHRGTNRGREPVVPPQKKQYNRERRVELAENRTAQQVEQMNYQLNDLMEECKIMKKQLDESKRLSQEKQTQLEAQLKTIEDEGTEAREFKEKLLKEKDELTALKADLQGVLHYVRAKNREEEDF